MPKPASMTLALATAGAAAAAANGSPTAHGYPTPLTESHPHSAPLMASAPFRNAMTPTSAAAPPHSARTCTGTPPPSHHPGPLRLDCSALPPPPSSAGLPMVTSHGSHYLQGHPVDMTRLQAIYTAHRASFWASVAADYGTGANPVVLEQAWRGAPIGSNMQSTSGVTAQTPITPVGSPEDHAYGSKSVGHDKTRISAILGIDANPRSPKEREMVRRLEERCSVAMVGA